MSSATPQAPIHRQLGLTDAELADIIVVLGREPNHLELALYSVMWSEHCSYKSSRIHLRRLPTTAPHVLVGPGENAGVIDAGDGIAVAIRIESHNHPSAIEPHQGAATGVGGILRDIFTMGARPLAVMDPLFFGPISTPRQRWLVEGVVSGISSYGNSVGVPTIGGELTFDPCYAGNPLVNVLCMGALPTDRLVLGQASGIGNLAVLLGSTTGRDGIGGVSVLASAGFSGDDAAADDAKRPSVQVGDPFEEKRLIEACLELLDKKLVVGIQDLGGAGLACATSETAARGHVGMDVYVTAVPTRELGMEPWEIMTSESQERMLAIITPDDLAELTSVCERWEVRSTVIGRVTEPGRDETGEPLGILRIRDGFDGAILAEVPAASLADDAPLYERPLAAVARDRSLAADPDAAPCDDPTGDLLSLMIDPSWVYRQYDHQLFLNTVVGPGSDAALLRLAGPGLPMSSRGVAISTDSNPNLCAIDPRRGTELVLAEGVANLACVGATPKAVVNCLNFGNPEHPEVMWQLSEAIDGLAEGCNALELPVIGGNVSLYNESAGNDIDPTPVLGVLGIVDELVAAPPGLAFVDGATVCLLGPSDEGVPLGGSRWAIACAQRRGGDIPTFDVEAHKAVCGLVASLVAAIAGGGEAPVSAVHDVSGGGVAVALAEMAVAGGCGVRAVGLTNHQLLFNEAPSRFVVATFDLAGLVGHAAQGGVSCIPLGVAGGDRVVLGELVDVGVDELSAAATGSLEGRLSVS